MKNPRCGSLEAMYKTHADAAKERAGYLLNPDKKLKKHVLEQTKISSKQYKRYLEESQEAVSIHSILQEEKLCQSKKDVDYTESEGRDERQKKYAHVPSLGTCAQMLQDKVLIISVDNKLYYYNGCCYQPMNPNGLIELYRNHVNAELHGAKSMKSFTELYQYLLTDSRIKTCPDLSSLSNLVILKNGVYNIKKDKLMDFNPQIIAFSYVNASFVRGEQCPKFDRFIRELTGGNGIWQERIWMALGDILSLSLDSKKIYHMGQKPNSGKSLFGHFVQSLFEPQYVSSIALADLNGEFSLGTLVGKALNISLDLPSTKISASAVSKLKMLTGGDLITVNEKYVPQFKYQNRAKFLFASNHPLRLSEDDEAFWDRLVFLPFDYSVNKENQNTNLLKELLDEKDAVVSKALGYVRKLRELNYCFPTTKEIEDRIRAWRGVSVDTINGFIQKYCVIDEVYKGEIVEDLYFQYSLFCEVEKEEARPRKEFKVYLETQIGLKHCKMRREKGENPQSAFRGIKLKKEEDIVL